MPTRPGRKRKDRQVRRGRKQGHKKIPGRKGIAQRLKEHLEVTGQSRAELFEEKLGVASSTAWEWLVLKDPVTPSLDYCIKLAKKENLNLNWLLLGEGPRLREVMDPEDSLANRLHAEVVRAMMDKGATADLAEELTAAGEELLERILGYFRQRAFLTVRYFGLAWDVQDKDFQEALQIFLAEQGRDLYLGRRV
jgi:hypothetical protein